MNDRYTTLIGSALREKKSNSLTETFKSSKDFDWNRREKLFKRVLH